MPNQGVPVIFKNKIAYGYAEKSVQAYDVSVSDYNALTEQQQLDGSIRFIQGVDAIPNGSNVWAKLGTTPLAEGLPRDCSQAVNQLKSNLTDLKTLEYRSYFIGGNTQKDENDIFCVYNEHLKHVQIDAHPHTVFGSGTVPRGNYVIARVPFIPRYTIYIPINRTDDANVCAVLKIRKTQYNNQNIGEISVELLDNNTPKGIQLCTHLEYYYDDDSIIPSQS